MSLALNGAIFQQRGPCMGDVGDPFKDGGKCSIVKDTCTWSLGFQLTPYLAVPIVSRKLLDYVMISDIWNPIHSSRMKNGNFDS